MNIELEQQVTIDLDKLTDADRKALRAVLDAPKPYPQKGDDVAADAAWAAARSARAAEVAAWAAWAVSNDQSAMSRYIEYGVGLLEDK